MNSLSQLETAPSLRSGQTSGHKIHKDMLELSNTISQLDVVDTYMLLHPTTAEYIFFSSSHKTFIKTDDIPGHKTNLIF